MGPMLIEEINRKLRSQGAELRTAEGEDEQIEYGPYYLYDPSRKRVLLTFCNPERLAEQLGLRGRAA